MKFVWHSFGYIFFIFSAEEVYSFRENEKIKDPVWIQIVENRNSQTPDLKILK